MVAKRVSKRLVIDACVAGSSGKEDAIEPVSVHCRDFLQAVLEMSHKVVMTPAIRDEWNEHQSQFARKWRLQMLSKRKLEILDIPTNNKLWNEIYQIIESVTRSNKQQEEMIKDIHLVEAALVTDKTVISLDDNTARRFFSKAAAQVDELKDIVWVNPDKIEEEQPIEWLQNGANPETDRLLGTWCDR
ncbi:MAG TPA: hypothetical protein DD379_15535 [Cyanobacteria bacterium UBA11162]|nr:hypothetical protein [Cyanobacteria bacterium UBA11162]